MQGTKALEAVATEEMEAAQDMEEALEAMVEAWECPQDCEVTILARSR